MRRLAPQLRRALRLAPQSLLYEAVGIYSSKDNFWTEHFGPATDRIEVLVALWAEPPIASSPPIL